MAGAQPLTTAAKVLLCSTTPSWQGPSGYQRLAQYIPGSTLIALPKHHDGWGSWFLSRIARRLSATRSYQTGSLALEFRTWRYLRQHPGYQILHFLWANHDLGFFDKLRSPVTSLVATLHSCPDELHGTFRRPHRLEAVDAWILMSSCQKSPLVELGVPEEKMYVVPHGIDTDFYAPGSADSGNGGLPGSPFVVLHVGTHRRDLPLLRNVAENLQHDRGVRFEVISAPDTHHQFKHIRNVTCRSGLSATRLRELYQRSSCLLQLVTAATANNALLEGMACGLPVISQEVGGIPEYVGRDAGILCPPGDADAVVTAIRSMRSNVRIREAMSRAARLRALELRWCNVARATMRIYSAVIESGSAEP